MPRNSRSSTSATRPQPFVSARPRGRPAQNMLTNPHDKLKNARSNCQLCNTLVQFRIMRWQNDQQARAGAATLERTWLAQLCLVWMLALAVLSCPRARGAELAVAAHFRKNAQPILEKYCSDCHADGMKKGGVAFDEFKSDQELLSKHDLWLAVLKNIRAGLMPPAKKAQPAAEE